MEVLDIVLTVVSMLAGAFAWWQSHGSRKARLEADKAVQRAETQEKVARAEVYESRRQTEAMQSLIESFKEQVAAAEDAAAEARRLADSIEKQASQVEKIAASLQAPLFKVSKTKASSYALTYTGNTTVTVSVENINEFLRLDGLKQGMEFAPGQTFQFCAEGSSQSLLPDELVLNVSGHDNFVRVPLAVGG